jgi:hypothetical protein
MEYKANRFQLSGLPTWDQVAISMDPNDFLTFAEWLYALNRDSAFDFLEDALKSTDKCKDSIIQWMMKDPYINEKFDKWQSARLLQLKTKPTFEVWKSVARHTPQALWLQQRKDLLTNINRTTELFLDVAVYEEFALM